MLHIAFMDRRARTRAAPGPVADSRSRPRFAIIAFFATLIASPWTVAQDVIISEFLASNGTGIVDENGDSSDWIECVNVSANAVDLDGWYLTDAAGDLTRWRFPSRVLEAGAYLVVFASGKDRTGEELHTNFRLDADGDYLALVEPDGVTIASEFAPTYPSQRPDVSFGIGQQVVGDPLFSEGDAVRVHIPTDGALGAMWLGGDEPFDDSAGAGWFAATLGIGFGSDGGGDPGGGDPEIIGNPLVARARTTSSSGTVFLLLDHPFTRSGELDEWAFFSDTDRAITPLIFEENGATYSISGVGRTRTSVDGGGAQRFPFELEAGSASVGPGYFFGWKDGGDGLNNAGVPAYTQDNGENVLWFGQYPNLSAGLDVGAGSVLERTYSVEATAVPAAGGAGGVGDGGPELLAYWTFDRTTVDASGRGHSADLRGATYAEVVPSAVGGGQSLRFDGNGAYVSALIDVSETSYSMALWFRAESSGRGIFTVVDNDLGGGGHDRHIYLNGSNIASRVWNNETISSSGRSFADGRWHHLVHVVGAEIGGQRIYVDGELVATGSKSSSDFDWQQAVNIGFSNDAASDHFHGWIDEVAIWSDVLNEDEIAALFAGGSPLAPEGLSPFVSTNIENEMRGVNASAYVRIPFALTPPFEFDALKLRVRYDDGFAAYLNGIEVARRNAPAALDFDSRSTIDRSVSAALRWEEIDLTAHAGSLADGDNVFAVQALNDHPSNGEFLFSAELFRVSSGVDRYLSPPTPGLANTSGAIDFVADTSFSVDRGHYSAPFFVEITTETPGADIYYTLDGREPHPEAPTALLYDGPIEITTTTNLRAAAFKDGFLPTNVDTHTYIFLSDVARQPANPPGLPSSWAGFPADYGVDPDVVNSTLPGYSFEEALLAIPTMSVTTDPANLFEGSTGIYANSRNRGPAWERLASIELFYPPGQDGPDGRDGFQVNAGIRMHGNSSRNHGFTPKHPIRVLFKSRYGPSKLRYPLFDGSRVDRFDQILLRGASTDSWPVVDGGSVLGVQRWAARHATYMRDQWMRDAQIAMGRPSGHGTYVHLFLNGLYWGLYNPSERPTDSFNAEHLGGDKDEYDVIKDFAELQSGRRTAWDEMIALANAGLGPDSAYQRIQGNDPDGVPNPDFPNYLHVDSLIDYMVLHIYAGAEDWPNHNWWAARRRGPESLGYQFFVWDQEISNDSLIRTHTLFQTRFEDPISAASPSFLYGRLMANENFRRDFGDRVHRHLFGDGLLTAEASRERWANRATEIDRAIVGESARWGDSKKSVPYKREIEWLAEQEFVQETYWDGIHPIALERFRRVGLYPEIAAPVFHLEGDESYGGFVDEGDSLTMTVELVLGFEETTFVGRDDAIRAVVPADDSLGTAWRERTYSEGSSGETWTSGGNGVGYETGSGYENWLEIDFESEMSGGNTSVYVRIPFSIADAATIANLDDLVLRMVADDGFAAYLNGERIASSNAPSEAAIAWNSASTTGGEASPTSPVDHNVRSAIEHLRVGENLLAIHGLNTSPTSSDMLIITELIGLTEETGVPSGDIVYTVNGGDPMDPDADTYTGPISLTNTSRVRARTLDDGEWSALNEAVFVVESEFPLRITELMYHPPAPPPESLHGDDDFEFVEVRNVGPDTLDLSRIRIEGGVRFSFAGSAVPLLGPGEFALIVRNLSAFEERYDTAGMQIAGEYDGKLSNRTDPIRLVGPIGETLLELEYADSWQPATDGEGFSLVIVDETAPAASWADAASWTASGDIGGSPGAAEDSGGVSGWQRPGDGNQDGRLDVADALALLLHLFGGTERPIPCDGAPLASGGSALLLDVNGDEGVNVADAVALLNYLFANGAQPALGEGCVRIEDCPTVCGF